MFYTDNVLYIIPVVICYLLSGWLSNFHRQRNVPEAWYCLPLLLWTTLIAQVCHILVFGNRLMIDWVLLLFTIAAIGIRPLINRSQSL
jgi:hypothetical protein